MHRMVRVSRRELAKRHFRALRAGVGLSQMDAAIRAGISRTRYWRIENGYSAPTDAEHAKLARAFNVADINPKQPQAVAS